MQLGPPWSTSVVTPDRTPTMSASRPNRPVTWRYTCACVSIMPAITSLPVTSVTVPAVSAGMPAATAAMRPSLTATSARPSKPVAGSITRPPRNSRSNLRLIVGSPRTAAIARRPISSVYGQCRPGTQVWSARVWTVKESATPCHGWKTTACCAAVANSSPISACLACASLLSCAVRWRMRASAPSASRPGRRSTVFIVADLAGVQPIVANSGLPGFKTSVQPVLAQDKVRYVGEPIAVCVADSRAAAEDLAAAVEIDFDELPPVVDMRAALTSADARARPLARQRLPGDFRRGRSGTPRRRADRRAPAAAYCAAMHVADRGPRRGRHLGPPAGTTPALYLDADSRTWCAPGWPDASGWSRRASASSRPMLAAASATRACCWPRKSAPRSWPAVSAIRCAGSRTAASSSPPMRIVASMTTILPSMRKPTARWSASTPRPWWMPALTPLIRFRRAWKQRKSPASCPVPM